MQLYASLLAALTDNGSKTVTATSVPLLNHISKHWKLSLAKYVRDCAMWLHMIAITSLPYLTLPSGWAGYYPCPALRPYQFGPMRNPDVTRRSQWSALKLKSAVKPKN